MIILLYACAELRTIDGSSKDSFAKSILSLSKNLNDDDRASFTKALQTINGHKGRWPSTLDDPSVVFLSYVNGKTVADIKREASELEHVADILKTKNLIGELQARSKKLNQELVSLYAELGNINWVLDKLGALSISRVDGSSPKFAVNSVWQ
jgi:hypothetical protein